MVERRGVGQLGERRQRDPALAEAIDAARQRLGIDDPVRKTELVLESVAIGIGDRHGEQCVRRTLVSRFAGAYAPANPAGTVIRSGLRVASWWGRRGRPARRSSARPRAT